jgi:hypothetical protein
LLVKFLPCPPMDDSSTTTEGLGAGLLDKNLLKHWN